MRTLSLLAALMLVRVANRLDSAAKALAAPALGDRLCHVGEGAISVWGDCVRCSGKGYHHGFGEDGVDPDLCDECGGPGIVAHDLTCREVVAP